MTAPTRPTRRPLTLAPLLPALLLLAVLGTSAASPTGAGASSSAPVVELTVQSGR